MKKLYAVIFSLFVIVPVFAQADDPYAKFQGVWYGVACVDGGGKVIFIFIDDYCISINLDSGSFFKYNIEGQNLVIKNGRELNDSGWGDIIEIPDPDSTDEHIQYVFSGERLFLLGGGEVIISLSKDYTDFPEWR
jgi:hypothetical protein